MPPPLGATAQRTAPLNPSATDDDDDPYPYQHGFGNRHASEAVPGVLPASGNAPQRVRHDLFSEQLNGSAFVGPRARQQHVWTYRIRPAVAHRPLAPLPQARANRWLEADFSLANGAVEFCPTEVAWDPFRLCADDGEGPGEVDFVQGLRTVAGAGSAAGLGASGLAVHVYVANASMAEREAFCCNDGDLLVVPNEGVLDVRTELGVLRVRPGELLVVPAGIRFRVEVVSAGEEEKKHVVRGYVLEVFGAHFELPELGPLGANGMALPRDFEYPVASFEVDAGEGVEWEVVYKHGGKLWSGAQEHSPFDVVAWHGNYAPFKYAMDKFVGVANTEREQADPTVYTVLTAKSNMPNTSLVDFLAFMPRWSTTRGAFRPPYFHRNAAAELMGMAHGAWHGSGHSLAPGGLSFAPHFMPHGESYDRWVEATTQPLENVRVGEGALAFMFHVCAPVAVTRWAREKSGVLNLGKPEWEGKGSYGFLARLDEVEEDLRKVGLPVLKEQGALRQKNGRGEKMVGKRDGS